MKENEDLNFIPFELIIDEIEGIISTDNKKELQNWRTAFLTNEEIYQQFLKSSDKIELLSVYKKLNENESWIAFNKLLNPIVDNTPVVTIKTDKQAVVRTFRIVAAIAATILLFSSLYLLIFHNKSEVTIATLANIDQKVILPDSTELYLNGNTEIIYNKSTYLQSREITLIRGEIFLNVIHNELLPFVVKSGELQIKDIGTSFDINTDINKTDIIVNTGKVALIYSKNGEDVFLNPRQKGTFYKISKKITVLDNRDTNYKSWHDKKFQFIQTSLGDVGQTIEKAYGYHVTFQDSLLKNRKLTATFQNQSIDEIMHIIAVSLRLKMEKKGNTFLFKH